MVGPVWQVRLCVYLFWDAPAILWDHNYGEVLAVREWANPFNWIDSLRFVEVLLGRKLIIVLVQSCWNVSISYVIYDRYISREPWMLRVMISRLLPWFHDTLVLWNLGETLEIPTPADVTVKPHHYWFRKGREPIAYVNATSRMPDYELWCLQTASDVDRRTDMWLWKHTQLHTHTHLSNDHHIWNVLVWVSIVS